MDIRSGFQSLSFAADYMGNGAIHVPVFDELILDRTRNRGIILDRIRTKPATGSPTRWFEKEPHENKASFKGVRALGHDMDTQAKRTEKYATIHAIMNGTQFGHFDLEVTQQQAIYNRLKAEDLKDMIDDLLAFQNKALWTGAATSVDDTSSLEYCSILTQITQTGDVASGTRISEAICDAVAEMCAKVDYRVRPTAIYCNPAVARAIEKEEELFAKTIRMAEVTLKPGTRVKAIATTAGDLPIITDPFIPHSDEDFKIIIVDETLLERQYITTDRPRLYQMGIEPSLSQKFIALQYDTIIVKGGSFGHYALKATKAGHEATLAALRG